MREPILLSRVYRDMRLTPSTAHRYAATLAALGFLQQDRRRRYYVSQAAERVGASVLRSVLLRTGADEILRQLRDRTGFTAGLAVLDGPRGTYVRRYHAHGRGQYEADAEIRSGAHIALHKNAVGKALLASLPRVEATKLIEEIASECKQTSAPFDERALESEVTEAIVTGTASHNGRGSSQTRAVAAFVPRQIEGWSLAVDVSAPAIRVGMRSLRESVVSPLLSAVAQITTAVIDAPEFF